MNPQTFTATPDAPVHHAVDNLPDWLFKASPTTRKALKNARLQPHQTARHQALHGACADHMTQRNRLESRLANLQNPRDFALPLLTAAIKTRFGLELDVKTTYLRLYIPQHIPWFPIPSGAARAWTISLLDAALHNFEESHTHVAAFEPESTYITQPSPHGHFETLPAVEQQLPIPRFAQLCRELDIGNQYQAYLNETLGLTSPVASEVVMTDVIGSHKTALRAALHLAHLRHDLPTDLFQTMLDNVEGREVAQMDGQPLLGHDLTMMSSTLTGILVFAPEAIRSRATTRIIVYIPDDPYHPLKLYASPATFIEALTLKLRDPQYQAFFSRFVEHHERGYFFADLSRRLSHVTWHHPTRGDPLPSWRDTPIDHPDLRFAVAPIKTDLWTHLYQRQLNKILNDASHMAVSTASTDRAARWALWDSLNKVAGAIVEVASFVALPFVPFLGELMLGYMAYQLLDTTFEGIIDWAEGLQTEAFGQLIALTESVAQVGLFAAGGALVTQALSRVLSPETLALFASLNVVKTRTGQMRYWRPDLTPYEQSITLPSSAKPDELGLYHHQDKTLLRHENKLYAVKPDSETGHYQIEHPDRTDAFQPPLRHNGHGAWQTLLDDPLAWDRDTVVRRLGHSVEGFTRLEREQILRISGFHDNVLRESHVENQRPPSLLTDTIKRLKIDRDIRALIEQPDHPEREEALTNPLTFFGYRYDELEKTTDRHVQLLQGVERGLPTDIAQELVDNATGSELKQMHEGQVPRRLQDVANKAMEAVRTARAFEGFYLRGAQTLDTQRLALHSLESMYGWPDDLRIDLRAYSTTGEVLDRIGPDEAPIHKTLVCAADGTVHLAEHSEQAGTFYEAILQALSKQQRDVLELSQADGEALKRRIIDQAARTPSLRTLLARHPHRKTLYDPATMRLPGGTEGYFRRNSSTPTLDARVREIYPNLDREELRAQISRLQNHPDGARMALSRLATESQELYTDLDRWIRQTPTFSPDTGLALDAVDRQAMHHNRRLLALEIQRSWQRQSERDVDAADGSARYILRFAEPIPCDLPALRADFSHVSTLILRGDKATQGAPAFLKSFTGLRRLELHGFALDSLPEAIGPRAPLETLTLSDCAITFDEAAWSRLASITTLKHLDLSANQFKTSVQVDSLPNLQHLDLSGAGLTAIPLGALQHPRLDTLMLMNNVISQLPADLFESEVYERRGIQLTNNPLDDASLEQIKQHYFETSYDLGVAAPEADVQRVLSLYPILEPTQASDFVYELPGNFAEGRAMLTSLEEELGRVSSDLDTWTTELPVRHPLTDEALDAEQLFAEHVNREQFMQVLLSGWRHETELDGFDERMEPTYELVINAPILGELPTLRADFSHVSVLDLRSVDGLTRIGRFLEAFPNLKRLRLHNFDLGNLPDAVYKMGRLHSLALPGCRITLTVESANALAGLERLQYLDLASNPLGQVPDLSQMPDLVNVLLDHTGITELPNGLLNRGELGWADLSNNAITDVPSDILEVPAAIAQNLHLRNNPFTEDALGRLTDYYEKTGISFSVDAVSDRGEPPLLATQASAADE